MSDDILDRLRKCCEYGAWSRDVCQGAIAAIEQLREQATAYHRRAQQAEAAIAMQYEGGASLGRALANTGYRHWQERAEVAEAALAERDAEIARLLASFREVLVAHERAKVTG